MTATSTITRRARGTRRAAEGMPSGESVGAADRRQGDSETGSQGENGSGGAVRVSTCRRFIMIGHTVRISNPRAEWRELRGFYGTVTNQWGDGSVCVEVTRWGGGKSRISFLREEVEHVPMGDTLRHCGDEETTMIRRCANFAGMGSWVSGHGLLSEALESAIKRRADRIKVEIAAVHRHEKHDLQRQARWMELGLSNWCTALVPYTGGAES